MVRAKFVFESLEDDFHNKMVNNLINDDSGKWATYNVFKIHIN